MTMKTLKLFLIPLLLALWVPAQAATVNGVQFAKTIADPPQLQTQGTDGGHLKHCYDSYSYSADMSAADVIRLCRIPAGATVTDARLVFTAMSGIATVNIGWLAGAAAAEAGDSTGLGADISVAAAGVYSMFTSQSTATGFQKTFSETVIPKITVKNDSTASSGTYKLDIWYVVD